MVKINLEKRLNEIEDCMYYDQRMDRFKVGFNGEIKFETKKNLRKTWLAYEEFRRGLE